MMFTLPSVTCRRHQFRIFDPSRLKIGACVGTPVGRNVKNTYTENHAYNMNKLLNFLLGGLVFLVFTIIGQYFIKYNADYLIPIWIVLFVNISLIAIIVLVWREKIFNYLFNNLNEKRKSAEDQLSGLVTGVIRRDESMISNSIKEVSLEYFKFLSGQSVRKNILLVLNGLFVILGAIIGTVFLSQQNDLVVKQNDLIANQNIRLDQQTYLQEAERRSGLVFLFSNIMDQVDSELKLDYNQDNIRNLSPQLIGRIISLSQRLMPYRYLEKDQITESEYSPERAQLFINLIKSKLEKETLTQILSEGNFTYSDFNGIKMVDIDFESVDFSHSRFRNVDFDKISFKYTDIHDCTFIDSEFIDVAFDFVSVKNSVFKLNGPLDFKLHTTFMDSTVIQYTGYSENINMSIENSELSQVNIDGSFDTLNFIESYLENIELEGFGEYMDINNSIFNIYEDKIELDINNVFAFRPTEVKYNSVMVVNRGQEFVKSFLRADKGNAMIPFGYIEAKGEVEEGEVHHVVNLLPGEISFSQDSVSRIDYVYNYLYGYRLHKLKRTILFESYLKNYINKEKWLGVTLLLPYINDSISNEYNYLNSIEKLNLIDSILIVNNELGTRAHLRVEEYLAFETIDELTSSIQSVDVKSEVSRIYNEIIEEGRKHGYNNKDFLYENIKSILEYNSANFEIEK
ncbi:hypothetical protein CEQ90_19230 [Lewinellaceae bacterium SD302]|nr:hypothetical protein CEQ90_19230 [Lewinellaceae bacterium SD302]